jgi:hypothetical protein
MPTKTTSTPRLYWMLYSGKQNMHRSNTHETLRFIHRKKLRYSALECPSHTLRTPLRLRTLGRLPRLGPSQLRRPIIWLRPLCPPDRARARHGLAPQIGPVGFPCGAVHDGTVGLAGGGVGPKSGDLERRGRFVVPAGLLCEEGDATVFVARLYADGLWGDVAVILVYWSVG